MKVARGTLTVVGASVSPWLRGFLSAWVLLVAVAGSAAAQGISFTVQVIAVSDQQNAIEISRGLLHDGYPAYVVRSTGAEGDVFRVRVGAFGNRAAAARYAAAMPGVGGAEPVPMVAEAIPAGIMPLAPRVLWQGAWGAGELRVLPWPGGIALRQQQLEPLAPARYALVQGPEVRLLDAWWVLPLLELPTMVAAPTSPVGFGEVPFVDLRPPAPLETPAAVAAPAAEPLVAPQLAERGPTSLPEVGLLLLRDRFLWPSTWESDSPEVREAYAASSLALIAGRLGIDPAVVSEAVVRDGAGPPRLRTVEVSDRSGRDAGDVRSLASPEVGGAWGPGPLRSDPVDPWWPALDVGEVIPLAIAAATQPIGGAEWTLIADAAFVRINTSGGASWRAVAGTPLWSDGRYALVRDGSDLLLIDFNLR